MATFAVIVDTGSISAAARKLGVSPSAVSQQLSQLEEQIGLSLLHRSTRQLVLTEAGQRYYQHCAELIATVRKAESSISALREAPTGQLRITTSIGFALHHLPSALAPMLKEYPGLALQLISRDEQIDLYEHRIDLAIRLGRQRDSNLVTRTLARWDRVLCASPDYLRRYGVPHAPEDLEKHEFLTLTSLGGAEHLELHGPSDASLKIPIHGRISGDNSPASREMVRHGLGVSSALLPDVANDLAHGRLVRLLPDWHLAPVSIHAVTPGNELLPKVELAIESCRRYLQELQAAASRLLMIGNAEEFDPRGFLGRLCR